MADKFNSKLEGVASRYEYAAALCFYSDFSPYSAIPQSVKYHRRYDCAEYFGRMLGVRLSASSLFTDVDVIIPVPLHWTRRWRRGYNQAELIASAVASALNAKIRTDVLKRIRRTGTQTILEQEEKYANVRGAFVAEGYLDATHILILDDVFTSGATLAECYRALKPHCRPDARISAVTLSYVG